ncbi:MAG: hypothetical protein M0Z51_18050 [Propionibacterium sp.]|nr:hypothetical protein [Propionibacterium sp.]
MNTATGNATGATTAGAAACARPRIDRPLTLRPASTAAIGANTHGCRSPNPQLHRGWACSGANGIPKYAHHRANVMPTPDGTTSTVSSVVPRSIAASGELTVP